MEANYFASVTLFQHDRFSSEIKKLKLGIDSAIYLAKMFGASVHATLRTYVENKPKRCALLVLEKPTIVSLAPSIRLRNFFQSKPFSKEFGGIKLPNTFDSSWAFARSFLSQRKGIMSGSIEFRTEVGDEEFTYQFFNNYYNGFVLFYPSGEKQSAKTQFMITKAY